MHPYEFFFWVGGRCWDVVVVVVVFVNMTCKSSPQDYINEKQIGYLLRCCLFIKMLSLVDQKRFLWQVIFHMRML